MLGYDSVTQSYISCLTWRALSSADGERRPLLYLGYIVNQHYQSLLPVVEDDYMPPCLAQPAVDNALQNALQALKEAKAKESTQVSSYKTTNSHKTSKCAHCKIYFDSLSNQASAAVQPDHIQLAPDSTSGNEQVMNMTLWIKNRNDIVHPSPDLDELDILFLYRLNWNWNT